MQSVVSHSHVRSLLPVTQLDAAQQSMLVKVNVKLPIKKNLAKYKKELKGEGKRGISEKEKIRGEREGGGHSRDVLLLTLLCSIKAGQDFKWARFYPKQSANHACQGQLLKNH